MNTKCEIKPFSIHISLSSAVTHVHVGGQRVHQPVLGLFADQQPDALVDEVIVLERGQILVQLLVAGLAVHGAALQVELPARRRASRIWGVVSGAD